MSEYNKTPYYFEDGEMCGDIMTVEEYLGCVQDGLFIDYDGSGHPMKDGKYNGNVDIYPSGGRKCIPEDATHVIWFNR